MGSCCVLLSRVRLRRNLETTRPDLCSAEIPNSIAIGRPRYAGINNNGSHMLHEIVFSCPMHCPPDRSDRDLRPAA